MATINKPRRAGRPTAKEAEEKRARLIVVALEEFAREGFQAASLREIAGRAEISTRTLYNHYPDKLTLFAACLEYSERFSSPQPVGSHAGDLHERLASLAVDMHVHLSIPIHSQIAMLIFREAARFDELRQIARTHFQRYQVAPVAHVLEAHGVAAHRCNRLAAQFITMALAEWQRRLLFGEPPLADKLIRIYARAAANLFVDGCLADGRRAE